MLSYFSDITMTRIELAETMTGSEKQIAWALSIKLKTIVKIDKFLRNMGMASGKLDTALELQTKMLAKAETLTDAKWWIDNQYMTENDLAKTFCM